MSGATHDDDGDGRLPSTHVVVPILHFFEDVVDRVHAATRLVHIRPPTAICHT